MYSIAKILCLGAIGNYFMVNVIHSQSRMSELHENSTGMTSSIHCGNIHPSLSGIDSCAHYGISVLPAPMGIWNISRLALCADFMRSKILNAHASTEFLSIDHMSILHCDMSTSWNIHDLPFIPGIALKSEFMSFDDGILHCTDLTMGIGAIMNIHEKARAGILIQYPFAKPSTEIMSTKTHALMTIGIGFSPIDDLDMDIDYVMNSFTGGLRPMISWRIDSTLRTKIGYALPYSSMTLGLSMRVDDIFVQADIFNHMYLGFSWQIGMRYCPDIPP